MWMQLYNNTMEGAIFSDALCSFIELEPYKIYRLCEDDD